MAIEVFTAFDVRRQMMRNDISMVVFRPDEAFPNERPPRPAPGWRTVNGDANTMLYIHELNEQRDLAYLKSLPPMWRPCSCYDCVSGSIFRSYSGYGGY